MSALGFETVEVSGAEAVATLHRLRQEGRGIPVLLGEPEGLDELVENQNYTEESPAELLEMAADIDPVAWLQERHETYVEEAADYAEEGEDFEADLHGDWPEEDVTNNELITPFDLLTREPLERVVIGLIPCEAAWQIPCHLKLGGWNECPYAVEQSALFHYWEKKYGARIVAATGDVIECEVENPPTTREEALALAQEQFTFCSDIVHQGCETLEVLAATLLNGKVWYFWWD